MTIVDLDQIGVGTTQRITAMHWCYDTYGPTSTGRWNMRELKYFEFQNSKDATIFILKWS